MSDSAQPTIPLSPDMLAAYTDLYNKYEAAIEDTPTGEKATRDALLASESEVDDILTQNAEYKFGADTAWLEGLQKQIVSTNKNLVALKAQIAAVASHIATAGDIVAAIDKVITLLPA